MIAFGEITSTLRGAAHMTADSWRFVPIGDVMPGVDSREHSIQEQLFRRGLLALQEGKTFHQFTDTWDAAPRYAIPLESMVDRRNGSGVFNTTALHTASGVNESANWNFQLADLWCNDGREMAVE